MNDKIKKLLKGAGFSDDVISLVEKDDKDFDVQKAVESNNEAQKEHYKSLLENEIKEEVKDKVIKERDGQMMSVINTALKKAGVPMAEIETAEVKDKMKAAVDHFKTEAEKSAGKTNEDFKAIQEENLELKNKLSEKEDWLPKTEIENERQKLQAERKAEKADSYLRQQFTSIPANKILGNKHSDGIFLAASNILKSKYDVDYENDQVVFYKKGTKTQVTGKNAEGKDDFLKSSDILMNELKALSFIVESNGQGGEGQRDQNSEQGQGSEKKLSPRRIELEKKIAEQSAS